MPCAASDAEINQNYLDYSATYCIVYADRPDALCEHNQFIERRLADYDSDNISLQDTVHSTDLIRCGAARCRTLSQGT